MRKEGGRIEGEERKRKRKRKDGGETGKQKKGLREKKKFRRRHWAEEGERCRIEQ